MPVARTQQYREGGWGWFVVLSAFLAGCIFYGNLKVFGIILTAVAEDFDVDLGIIGSIVSLHIALVYALSPVIAVVARKVGSRYVATFGGILYALGLVLASAAQGIVVLATTVILLAGIGSACVIYLAYSEIAFYFKEKYALVSFVAMAGAPVGMVLFGPVAQVLLDTYGWRGTMLLIGGIASHLTAFGLLIKRPAVVYPDMSYGALLTTDAIGSNEEVSQQEPDDATLDCSRLIASAFSLDILLTVEFILVSVSRMLSSSVYAGAVIYLVPNGLSLGLIPSEASLLTTTWGIGNIAGLSLAAGLLHFSIASAHATAGIAAGVAAIGFGLSSYIPTFVGQMVNTFILGVALDCVCEVLTVMTRCLPFSEEKLISVLGWQMFLSGVAMSLLDTISGWLHDVTGGFHATFFLFSAALLSVILCLLLDEFRTFYIRQSK